ncbi:fibritin neck whiskers protein [Enterobacteria phage RB5]|uniref:Fibritin neck whiskers protein n=6 Tax=Tequatrovirus RB3 TaxID=1914203 RepID=A0A097J138_BPR03|nr:fibritin neck whisker [Escherichia phage RB3]AIT73166.1 fibritin neck whiskers protein [Enterobacteria phage RB5]AIT73437.1 fibritin neck whiskers protein [Enterobacteria phage RB6]AIT73708.1 fibritin neck whiskers protein [Enterobacteria phage RB7]AIT73980.1 fibritin neck whiskers protein [Enterobacteria phage RB9]AIT74253.1 fibritin neck whiskers protein [Enterobacteria phage RB10]
MIELKELPFVDSVPGEGQERISWIKNGEEILGASTKYGNDGSMNRPIVSVFKNVEVLDENVGILKTAIETSQKDIKTIQGVLDVSGDIEALSQISVNKNDISNLKTLTNEHTDILTGTNNTVDKIIADIGPFNDEENSVYRTIRNDLLWIKQELGQYSGQDINGLPVVGNASTGMKHRIITNSTLLSSQGIRLSELENKFTESDVGSLTVEVGKLRDELGNKPVDFGPNIYNRLSIIDDKQSLINSDIAEIKSSIGYPENVSIITEINNNKSSIEAINNELNQSEGVKQRLTSIETSIGSDDIPSSIKGKIKNHTTSIESLNGIVGENTSSGLRANVSWLNQIVGTDSSGGQPSPSGSLLNKVSVIEGEVSVLNNNVQNIQVEIGNNKTGIKVQVIELTSLINGNNPDGSTVEERGLTNSVKTNETNIAAVTHEVNTAKDNISSLQSSVQALQEAGYIPEAPKDGQAYVRKDGEWVLLSTFLSPA